MSRKRMWEIGAGLALLTALLTVIGWLFHSSSAFIHQRNLNGDLEYNLIALRRAEPTGWPFIGGAVKSGIRSGAWIETRGKIQPGNPPPTGKGAEGCTALMVAAEIGDTAFVDELLKRGADVHAVDNAGDTALSLSRKKGHLEIVRLLKQHGATK